MEKCNFKGGWYLKAQVERFRCVRGRRGRPGDTKATGDSKDQLAIIYAHKWLLSWFTGPLLEKRRWYIIYDIVVLNCLFMVDWFSCWFPGSWRRALNIKQTHRSNIFIKKKTTTTIIGLTWRLFFVCSSCLFTFSLWRGHAYQAMLSLAMHGSNRFALKLHRSPLFACLVEDKSN